MKEKAKTFEVDGPLFEEVLKKLEERGFLKKIELKTDEFALYGIGSKQYLKKLENVWDSPEIRLIRKNVEGIINEMYQEEVAIGVIKVSGDILKKEGSKLVLPMIINSLVKKCQKEVFIKFTYGDIDHLKHIVGLLNDVKLNKAFIKFEGNVTNLMLVGLGKNSKIKEVTINNCRIFDFMFDGKVRVEKSTIHGKVEAPRIQLVNSNVWGCEIKCSTITIENSKVEHSEIDTHHIEIINSKMDNTQLRYETIYAYGTPLSGKILKKDSKNVIIVAC
jgi:hypothetical protein